MSIARVAVRSPLARILAIAVVLVLVATAAVWWLFLGGNDRRITAYFTGAVGLYSGGDVRILGVPVGHIDSVTPQGQTVRVTMSVQRDVRIPADAGAVEINPSVVSDRYVQLTPPYRGGPTMPDGATIPQSRTATPVELDQIYQSLNQLTTALGPNGANSSGALSQLLNTGAANLGGNGQALSDTLQHLGQLGTTLSGSSQDLFATLDNLQKFTSTLAADDGQVRQFNTQMQQVSGYLAGERQDLAAALTNLAVALGKVQSFVQDNRAQVKSNVDQLNSVAQLLAQQKAALNEALTDAPLALNNLNNAYNASSGTLDTRADINELAQPAIVGVCKLLKTEKPPNVPQNLTDTCGKLQSVVDGVVPLPSVAQTLSSLQQGTLPPLPLQLGGGGR
jgi:phospholipid/cholesterol/gamma-HCH transport system substrate-binding protein